MEVDKVLEKIRSEVSDQLGKDKVGPITLNFTDREWSLLLAEIDSLRQLYENFVTLFETERVKADKLSDYIANQQKR